MARGLGNTNTGPRTAEHRAAARRQRTAAVSRERDPVSGSGVRERKSVASPPWPRQLAAVRGRRRRRAGHGPEGTAHLFRRRAMERIGRFALVMLVACCGGIAAGVAWSQDTPAMPKPGDEVKALAPVFGVSGTWHGKVEAGAMGPDSKATVAHGKAMCHPIVGGMWYVCDVEDTWGSGKDAMTWKGHMTVGYDLASKSYKATVVDNMGTLTVYDGTLNGTTFVLETPSEVMMMGTSMKDRLTWDFSDPKAVKFSNEHKPSGVDWTLSESATLMPLGKSAAKPVAAAKE